MVTLNSGLYVRVGIAYFSVVTVRKTESGVISLLSTFLGRQQSIRSQLRTIHYGNVLSSTERRTLKSPPVAVTPGTLNPEDDH